MFLAQSLRETTIDFWADAKLKGPAHFIRQIPNVARDLEALNFAFYLYTSTRSHPPVSALSEMITRLAKLRVVSLSFPTETVDCGLLLMALAAVPSLKELRLVGMIGIPEYGQYLQLLAPSNACITSPSQHQSDMVSLHS